MAVTLTLALLVPAFTAGSAAREPPPMPELGFVSLFEGSEASFIPFPTYDVDRLPAEDG